MKNDRLYYWGTITVLVLMMLYTHSEYKGLEKLVEDSQRIYNRQLQLLGESNRKTVDRLTEALDSK